MSWPNRASRYLVQIVLGALTCTKNVSVEMLRSKMFRSKCFVRKRPKSFENVRKRSKTSENVRKRPKTSENVRKRPKTFETSKKSNFFFPAAAGRRLCRRRRGRGRAAAAAAPHRAPPPKWAPRVPHLNWSFSTFLDISDVFGRFRTFSDVFS